MSKLPIGWAKVPLEDLGDWGSGGTPRRSNSWFYSEGTIPWLVIGDLNDGVVTQAQTYITEEGLLNSSAKLLPPNTLLIAMYGSIGKLGIAGLECATNQAIAFCIPHKKIVELNYLFYVLKHFRKELILQGKGVAQKNISQTILKAYQIPLAPLNEQKRIVKKLDSLLARANICHAKLAHVSSLTRRFRQSVLALATSGDLTLDWREIRFSGKDSSTDKSDHGALPVKWEWKLISEIGNIQLGRQRAPRYHSGQYMCPYLRVQNVFEDKIDLSDVMEMDFPPDDFEKYQLVYGDILLNEGQSPEFLGRPAMYRGELPGACFTNTLIRFQAFDLVNRDFALLVFRHYMHSGRFIREGKITTNIAHLSAGRFSKIEFPLPPIDEQQEIVNRSRRLFDSIDYIEKKYQNALEKLDQTKFSILSQAFRGELVFQDKKDEPVSILIERMRATKEGENKKITALKKSAMLKLSKKSVRESIKQLPEEVFTFDELRKNISGDYDLLRDILFDLLGEQDSIISQFFDGDLRIMKFSRKSQ